MVKVCNNFIACISFLILMGLNGNLFAQNDSLLPDGFRMVHSGLSYKIVEHGKKKRKPVINDHIEMHIHVHVGDSVIFDSRSMNNNLPVPFQITQPKFEGDPVEGFMMMCTGDSAEFRVPVALMKKSGNQMLPWMKEGQDVQYNVVLVSVMSDEEQKKDIAKKTAKQKKIDKKILKNYFTKNNIKPEVTESGIYYTVKKKGSGTPTVAGKSVSVNYTGKLINGSVFDSNTDPAYKHKEPFTFELGTGKVIKGWDEGLLLFNKGGAGTIYIPSYLAYGSQDRSPGIPANSILIFDIEITDVGK